MLKHCIQAENRKLHASPIWVLFFTLPLISAIYGTFNYLQNLEILKDGWYSLWTQLESNHGKSGQTDGPFSGEICCSGKTDSSDTSVCIFTVCVLWKSFRTSSGISTDDPADLSVPGCIGSTCSHCGTACTGYGHPKLCHSNLARAGGRYHRSAGRE